MSKAQLHDFQYDEKCFYCGGTGFVPVLFRPIKNKISLPYIREFSCKCSRGLVMNHPRPYFNEFDDLQFEDQISKYPDLSYPQIVDRVKMEKIKEYQNA